MKRYFSQSRFEWAISIWQKALELVSAAQNNELIDNIRKRLELYR